MAVTVIAGCDSQQNDGIPDGGKKGDGGGNSAKGPDGTSPDLSAKGPDGTSPDLNPARDADQHEAETAGDSPADVDPDGLARHMVRQTIEHHFEKEKRNRKLGIKTLSLFFVARVSDYRLYDDETGVGRNHMVMARLSYAVEHTSAARAGRRL